MELTTCERYPVGTVILANGVGLGTWAVGAYVMSGFGILWLIFYLGYCLWIEWRLLRHSCGNCYYYGRRCAFGKGELSALLFRRGNPQVFTDQRFTWKDVVPDFLVSLIPLTGGLALLIMHFDWRLVLALAAILALSSYGNALVRGKLACSRCKQRDIGCPAATLFFGKQGLS